MTLTTTGGSANAYVTLAEADAYWFARNDTTWLDDTADADREAAIIEATQYIDATFRDRFTGYIRTTSQALEWPRTGAWDRSGRYLNGIPQAVKDATCELALAATSARLVPVQDRGGETRVERVKAGPVETETEYKLTAAPARTYRFAEKLLENVLMRGGRVVRV